MGLKQALLDALEATNGGCCLLVTITTCGIGSPGMKCNIHMTDLSYSELVVSSPLSSFILVLRQAARDQQLFAQRKVDGRFDRISRACFAQKARAETDVFSCFNETPENTTRQC